ncbi:hypothetical protein V1477_011224 [Vespula maculifrons]|uniref:Uncharacterized protein n=1 Tax=Vespula maculifrons TaxID=7453 RepID=A0ABD2C4A7_VESMC
MEKDEKNRHVATYKLRNAGLEYVGVVSRAWRSLRGARTTCRASGIDERDPTTNDVRVGTTCTHVELKQCVGVNPRGEESRVWVVRRESRYGANVRGLTAATEPTVQHSPPRGFSVPPTTSDISADPEKSEEEIDSIRDEGVGAILSERERFEVRFK